MLGSQGWPLAWEHAYRWYGVPPVRRTLTRRTRQEPNSELALLDRPRRSSRRYRLVDYRKTRQTQPAVHIRGNIPLRSSLVHWPTHHHAGHTRLHTAPAGDTYGDPGMAVKTCTRMGWKRTRNQSTVPDATAQRGRFGGPTEGIPRDSADLPLPRSRQV